MDKTTHTKFASSATQIAVLFLLLFCVFRTDVSFGQDFGLPDSVYFGEPSYSLDGCSGIKMKLPVYLWSDRYSDLLWYGFKWEGNTECDTVFYFFTGECDSIGSALYRNLETNIVGDGMGSWSGGFTPTIGTQKFMDCVFSVDFGDTIRVWVLVSGPPDFHLGELGFDWVPSVMQLDVQIVIPSEFVVTPGDVDCSSLVTISDAVYLIQYIFAGGCSPFDSDAADADGSCQLTVSDAVYLINYIFAGGPPPQAGCVAP